MPRLIISDRSDFKYIRQSNAVYVDKTKQIYDCMVHKTYSFLSRPRRFGKSLLCSTLKELFLANRELFKGLWIDNSDWEWKKHPVIHLDMTSASGKGKEIKDIERALFLQLEDVAEEFGIHIKEEDRVETCFSEILKALCAKTGVGVVVIIDEYDKPMLDALGYPEHMKDNQALLQRFYAQLKNSSEYLRFVFLTGVYKFAQTSVFSGLNNIQDLTFDIKAGDLCGYTQEEMETNFGPEIDALMTKASWSRAELLIQLKENYNGYIFGYDAITGELSKSVYNSFAINTVFSSNEIVQNGWFRTGSPSFLIKQLELREFEPIQTEKLTIDPSILINSCRPESLTIETLLYFAGYVTIKEYVKEDRNLVLHLPNQEVSSALAKEIMPRMERKRISSVAEFENVQNTAQAQSFETPYGLPQDERDIQSSKQE